MAGARAPSMPSSCGIAALHFYLGLYLLFFIWLFAFTGLLLNHPRWQFAQFWPNRVQRTTEATIAAVTAANDIDRARDVMEQLGIAGEVQWPAAQPANGPFTFQVNRPGLILDVKADLRTGRATVQRTELNGWGVMHALHTFTGAPATDSRNRRDWTLTTVWALSMDARRGRADRDGPRQLRDVVPIEGQAHRRNRCLGTRLPQLWSVRRCIPLVAMT